MTSAGQGQMLDWKENENMPKAIIEYPGSRKRLFLIPISQNLVCTFKQECL